MATDLDPDAIDNFHEHGAAILRGVFRDWVETLRAGIAENMEHPGPDAKIYTDEETGGRFLSDYCNWDRIPEYRDFIFNSPAAEIGAALMGGKSARLFHEHVLVKEAATAIATPWHQDLPYYCVDGRQTVSLWIPLDDVPLERCPEFIGGSHKWEKFFQPQRFNGQPLNEGDTSEAVPDIDANRDDYTILSWPMEPGDAIAFDYRTLHGAPANLSATTGRRAFSLRLVGDDARFVRREGVVTSPPFGNVKLESGAPLDGPEFPVLLSA